MATRRRGGGGVDGAARWPPAASLLAWAVLAAAAVGAQATSIDNHELPSWFGVVAAGAAILVGLMETFFGYRLFRLTLFVLSFAAAGITVFLVTWARLSSSDAMWIGLGCGGAAGLVAGVLSYMLFKVGVFVLGSALGVVGGLVLNTTVLGHFGKPLITEIVACVLLGIITGVLSLFLMRITMVVATSVIGSYSFIKGLQYYAHLAKNSIQFTNDFDLEQELQNGQSIPTDVYGFFAGMAVLACIGIVVQLKWTAKKKTAEKDAWEQEFEDSEISLQALQGKKKKKKKSKASKEAKRIAKKYKKGKGNKRVKADALLHDYEEGGEFYEGAGAPYDQGGYYEDESAAYDQGGYDGYDGYDGGAAYTEEDPGQYTQAAPKKGKKKSLISW